MLRVLLVDDEPLARERLRRLLTGVDDVEVVGEAQDGESALEQVEALSPDVLLLDVQMPGCSGLEVAASLGAEGPRIIFCTAFDEHAVDAFELAATDYLLKPVTQARLRAAVERVRAQRAEPARPPGVSHPHPRRVLARSGSRYRVVPLSSVLVFTSEGGLTEVRTAEERSWLHPSLNELETRLDPTRFCRVSRAALVNLDAVREVVPDPAGGGIAVLVDGSRLDVSRRRLKTLVDRLGG